MDRSAHRHIYNHEELTSYFERIDMPVDRRIYDVSALSNDEKLIYLNLLQKHQLCRVPWENLVQHYSIHRTVSLQPKWLLRKMLTPGRGGYCMEANYFFHLILVTLGFSTYIVGSRIFMGTSYGGWTHCVNIVTIDGKYLLDGGYGPQGPHKPIPLREGITPHVGPADVKLSYETLPEHLDRTQKCWILSYRYNKTTDFYPVYCFTELEFLPSDIKSMNFAPWLDKQTFFTHKAVCVRFTAGLDDNLEGEIDGAMTINHDVFKWRRNGEKVVEIHMKSEQERVDILKKYFGIDLTDEDIEGISFTAAAIGSMALPSTEHT